MGKGIKKIYAVKRGRKPGIYNSWLECKAQIDKFKNCRYKSFCNLEEAKEFLKSSDKNEKNDSLNKKQVNNSSKELNKSYAYIDGSFNKYTKYYGYGGFLMHEGKKYIIQGSGNKPNYVKMRNVSGEIIACQEVTKKAIELGIKDLDIYYDYYGIEKWATGKWKRNLEETENYHNYMQSIKSQINIKFKKVEGHSGDKGNDEADRLAKEAVNIGLSDKNNINEDFVLYKNKINNKGNMKGKNN